MNELRPKEEPTPDPRSPGRVNYAPNANYSNCLAVRWENIDAVNQYFIDHQDHLLVHLGALGSTYFGLVAKSLSDEDLDFLTAHAQAINELRDKRLAEKREAEEAAKAANEKAQLEERALIDVGRKCREHHAPLIEDVRKLKEEVKKLRKGKK